MESLRDLPQVTSLKLAELLLESETGFYPSKACALNHQNAYGAFRIQKGNVFCHFFFHSFDKQPFLSASYVPTGIMNYYLHAAPRISGHGKLLWSSRNPTEKPSKRNSLLHSCPMEDKVLEHFRRLQLPAHLINLSQIRLTFSH